MNRYEAAIEAAKMSDAQRREALSSIGAPVAARKTADAFVRERTAAAKIASAGQVAAHLALDELARLSSPAPIAAMVRVADSRIASVARAQSA